VTVTPSPAVDGLAIRLPTYKLVRWYVQRRLQRWLVRRSGQGGTGYRQYPDKYLYETLGLFTLPRSRADLPSAKA